MEQGNITITQTPQTMRPKREKASRPRGSQSKRTKKNSCQSTAIANKATI